MIYFRRGNRTKVRDRSLFCYWASRELGISLTELAGRFGLSVHGVGSAAETGELIGRENNYQLLE